MKRVTYALMLLVFACALTLGCAGMTHTQQKTLSGGAIGAAGGAVVGAVVGGNPAVGAAVGGAAGAGVGYVIGEHDQGRW